MSVHVDQTKELACLSDIINAFEDRRRIMLLRGDKGRGKTAFLGKAFTLYEELTPIAWSDLRQLSDPIELMDNLANQFRTQGVALERYFDASLMEERRIHVAVTNSRLKGSPVDVSVERSAREDRVRRATYPNHGRFGQVDRTSSAADSTGQLRGCFANAGAMASRYFYPKDSIQQIHGLRYCRKPTPGSVESSSTATDCGVRIESTRRM